jgi:hypothetical protein
MLQRLCEQIAADLERPAATIVFLRLLEQMRDTTNPNEITGICHILDYCMRILKFPELGDAMKYAYPNLKNPSIKLELEAMIKRIFDPNWEGGEFAEIDLTENIWDLTNPA